MKFKKILTKKDSNETIRRPNNSYNKQRAYHYSSVRSDMERNVGRRQTEYNNDQINPKDDSKSANIINRSKHILIILACLMLCGYLSYLRTDKVNVQNSGVKLSLNQIESDSLDYLNSSIFNKSKLTLKRKGLESYIKNRNNYVSNVDVRTKIFSNKVFLNVTLNQPSLVITDGSKLYLVADNGLILSDITTNKDQAISQLNLPLVQDQTAVRLEVGKPALSQEQVKYIREIIYQTEKSGIKTESITLAEGGSQINVKYGGLSYYVKYNFYEDARRSAGAFIATKQQLEAEKALPSEYIDVRVAERAYVK